MPERSGTCPNTNYEKQKTQNQKRQIRTQKLCIPCRPRGNQVMTCISPVTIKKGGVLSTYPCQKCNFCLQNRRADWTFRLNEQMKVCNTSHFLTLTYDEQNQPTILDHNTGELQGTLNKRDLQLFIKKLRKENDNEPNQQAQPWPTIKYYAVGEYGGETFRPHYHLIIFNIKPNTLTKLPQLWSKGFITVGTCEPASIHYTTKYVLNKTEGWEPLQKPFALISKGIGRDYLDTNGHEHKEALKTFVVRGGTKLRLPRYFSDRIFSLKDKRTIKELSVKQNDLLHNEATKHLKQFHPVPETYLEYCIRLKHENLLKSIKNPKNTEL